MTANNPDKNSVSIAQEIIDSRPISSLQILVLVLCGFVAIADGFDVQAIAFAAPAISQDWGVPLDTFGMIFATGLFGMLLGALIQGPIADRFGRKPVIITSVFIFGLFTFATAFTQTISQLCILRFIAGLGMGSALPNFIGLTSEFAPTRTKSRMVAIMNAGFPAGGFLGGMLSAKLISDEGWQIIFFVGGVVPLLLVPLLLWALPESILFYEAKAKANPTQKNIDAFLKQLKRLGHEQTVIWDKNLEGSATKPRRLAINEIFADGRLRGTLLLWLAFFCSLILFYGLVSWLPSILFQAGLSQQKAIIVAAILNFGSIIGGYALAWSADTYNARPTLALNYVGAAIICIIFGLSIDQNLIILMTLAASLGFCFGGGIIVLNAFASTYYPTEIRSTGLGGAVVAGRLGSLTGPLLGGSLLAGGMAASMAIGLLAIPATITAVAVISISKSKH